MIDLLTDLHEHGTVQVNVQRIERSAAVSRVLL